MAALRVLTFTTLYPNAAKPNHGVFIENRLRQTLAHHDMRATVLAPVPFFPFSSDVFGAYARYARAPQVEERYGVQVHHPRYLLIPKVGMHAAPWLLYRSDLRRAGDWASTRHRSTLSTRITFIQMGSRLRCSRETSAFRSWSLHAEAI